MFFNVLKKHALKHVVYHRVYYPQKIVWVFIRRNVMHPKYLNMWSSFMPTLLYRFTYFVSQLWVLKQIYK